MRNPLSAFIESLRGGGNQEETPETIPQKKPDYSIMSAAARGRENSLGSFISELRQCAERCGQDAVIRSGKVSTAPYNTRLFGARHYDSWTTSLQELRAVVVSGSGGNVAFSCAIIGDADGRKSTDTTRIEPSREELEKSGAMGLSEIGVQEAIDGVCLHRAQDRNQRGLDDALAHIYGQGKSDGGGEKMAGLLREINASPEKAKNTTEYARTICEAFDEMSPSAQIKAGQLLVQAAQEFHLCEQNQEQRREKNWRSKQLESVGEPKIVAKGPGSTSEKPDYFVLDQVSRGEKGTLQAFISELRRCGEKCGEGAVIRAGAVPFSVPGNHELFFEGNYSNVTKLNTVVVSGPQGNVAFTYARIWTGVSNTQTNNVKTEPGKEALEKSGMMGDKAVKVQEAIDGVCLYRARAKNQEMVDAAISHVYDGEKQDSDRGERAAELLRKIHADPDRDKKMTEYAKTICEAPGEMSPAALAQAGQMLAGVAQEFHDWEQKRERALEVQPDQEITRDIKALGKPSVSKVQEPKRQDKGFAT